MKEQHVILVNEKDEPVGLMEKMEAHRKGLLHRAFSIFIFNEKGEMLLQQRAAQKYHGAGLWTNACCSHPWNGEAAEDAALRRLQEELGFVTPLKKIFSFTYHAEVENNLIEHEYDHVFAGEWNGPIPFNASEVQAVVYRSLPDIKQAISRHPEQFTAWFRIALPQVEQWWGAAYAERATIKTY